MYWKPPTEYTGASASHWQHCMQTSSTSGLATVYTQMYATWSSNMSRHGQTVLHGDSTAHPIEGLLPPTWRIALNPSGQALLDRGTRQQICGAKSLKGVLLVSGAYLLRS